MSHRLLCRTNNRIFVGYPLCRNEEFMKVNIKHATLTFTTAIWLRFVPQFLKGHLSPLYSGIEREVRKGIDILRPEIERRRRCMKIYGDQWMDKPFDFLQWLMDARPTLGDDDASMRELTCRIILMNFASVQATSSHFTKVLYKIIEHPEYLEELRQEVESVVSTDGWTRAAASKMYKMDSFLRETQRLSNAGAVSLLRIATEDFTLHDGTFIPKNTVVSAASEPIHHDQEIYEDPHTFRPWRFLEETESGELKTRRAAHTTNLDYLVFGHGRHACTGRFFAMATLKCLIAYIIMYYDVKFSEDTTSVPENWIMGINLPNPSVQVRFKQRDKAL
ncbi:cytochrome P450 [Abortiporus biennis]|nr:cytochrome P450 [Abortiporus biennis]